MRTYLFPMLFIDKWNSYHTYGEGNIVKGKLRLWNKNANKWVWFKNPRPSLDSYSIVAERERSEYYFVNYIVKPTSSTSKESEVTDKESTQ